MARLEEAVSDLATALAALETRLDERLGELGHDAEAADAARRHAREARAHANAAADGLAAAIGDLKTMLSNGAAKE